ncbi:MAG: hypothetical protein IT236_09225 [Bacteroidia bacterium]|nr:hypothetical protein [Bacteroidia bacterium]
MTVDLSDMVGFVEKIKNVNFDAMLDSIRNTNSAIVPLANTITVVSSSATVTKLSVNTMSNTGVSSFTLSAPAQTLHTKNTVLPDSVTVKSTKSSSVNPLPDKMPETHTVAVITSSVPVVKVAEKKDSIHVSPADSVLKASVNTHTLLIKNDSNLVKNTKTKTDSVTKHITKTDSVNKVAIVKTTSLTGTTQPTVGVSSPGLVVTSTVNSTNTKSLSVKSSTNSSAGNKVLNDNFEPNTAVQEKMMVNAYRYGDITYDSLEFRVQVSAFKNNQHYFFPKLEKFGKIEKVELGDGYKRLMLGGSFKTYGRAFAYAKKVIRAGHDEVFIVVVYKGYRYSVEDLEAVGIFK